MHTIAQNLDTVYDRNLRKIGSLFFILISNFRLSFEKQVIFESSSSFSIIIIIIKG